jgi:fatty-acyl-CoA synthase
VKTIRSVPLQLTGNYPGDFEIRGEIFMPRKAFDAINREREEIGDAPLANPRNAASGTMKMQDSKVVSARKLDCFLYNVLGEGLGFQPIEHPGSEAICDIVYTSGTTGFPKGVILTHDMMLRTAFGSAWARGFEDGRRILFSLPLYHVYGYVEGLLACMFVGGAIIPQTKFDPADSLTAIDDHHASDVLLIPAMTLALMDAQKKLNCPLLSLRSVLSSGGRAPSTIWQQIINHLHPLEITTGYGMTEVTASSTVTRPDDPMERLLTTNGRLRDVGPAADPDLDGRLVV